MERFEELLGSYLDDDLGPAEDAEIAALVEEDPAKLTLTVTMFRESRTLASDMGPAMDASFIGGVMDRIEAEKNRFVSAVQRGVEEKDQQKARRLVFWRPLLAAAASIAIVVGIFVAMDRSRRPGFKSGLRVVAVSGGRAVADGVDLQAGSVVLPGGTVISEAGCLVSAELPDGSTVDLNEGTELALPGEGEASALELRRGALYVGVAPRPPVEPPFVVKSAGHRVTVLGTQFELATQGNRTKVAVEKGAVRLETTTKKTQVSSLFSVAAEGDMLMEPKQLMINDIATWRFREKDASKALALSQYKDGAVFLKDDFEQGIRNWQRFVMKRLPDGESFVKDKNPSAADLQGIGVKSEMIRGTRSNVLALDSGNGKDRALCVAYGRPVPLRAYSVEFDTKWARFGHASFSIVQRRKPEKILYEDPSLGTRIGNMTRRGKSYVNRMEYLFRVDSDGEKFMEIKNFVNGKLALHKLSYTDEFFFGCVLKKGRILMDNIVVREMVPKSP